MQLSKLASKRPSLRPQSRLGRFKPMTISPPLPPGVREILPPKPESEKRIEPPSEEEIEKYFGIGRFNSWEVSDEVEYTQKEWEDWENQWSIEEWIAWENGLDPPSPSIAPTESPIGSLDIPLEDDFIVPSDPEECEAFLDSMCWGDIESEEEEEL